MESSLNPPAMSMTLSMNPFKLTVAGSDYGSTLASPPIINQPFDLLVTCDADNFKIFVNGIQITGTISDFHIKSTKLVVPTVTMISYSITSTINMKITRISWNYSKEDRGSLDRISLDRIS